MNEIIYKFGMGITSGSTDVNLVGGKGAKLAQMGALGLPIPCGVTLTTETCNEYLGFTTVDRVAYVASLVDAVINEYKSIEKELGYFPLVSVRSGARKSMPGMMDTILNVGINSKNLGEWAERLGIEAANDCYCRLIRMYGETVIGIPLDTFDSAGGCIDMLAIYKSMTGIGFPQTLTEQLHGSISAVFESWNSDRAKVYRAIYDYSDDWGTAVNVQMMVFGNHNDQSGSGVLFSRDFNTGADEMIIDWLPNAQGEDVVSGTHTPKTKDELKNWNMIAFGKLTAIAKAMEDHYSDMQDMEFTIDNGELFILQTRDGKRSAQAAFKIAYDLYKADQISKGVCLSRVTGKQYIALNAPQIDPNYKVKADFIGCGAAGSIVSGTAVLSAKEAIEFNGPCILVTEETTPNDFAGMVASVGILTTTGGATSHAAVVARGMDKTCVVGAENLKIGGSVKSGDPVTIDGKTGNIWVGKEVPVVVGEIEDHVHEMIDWALKNDTSFLTVAPESVPESGTVYIDASASLTNQKTLSAALKLAKASGANGVIGFGNTDIAPAADTEFLGYFGVETRKLSQITIIMIEKVLDMKIWTTKMKKRWTLHLPSGTEAVVIEEIRAAGWKTVTVVNSFKRALSVDGYVEMEECFIDQLERENMTFGEIEKIVVAAGREVKELPKRVSKERLLFDVLGN